MSNYPFVSLGKILASLVPRIDIANEREKLIVSL